MRGKKSDKNNSWRIFVIRTRIFHDQTGLSLGPIARRVDVCARREHAAHERCCRTNAPGGPLPGVDMRAVITGQALTSCDPCGFENRERETLRKA